MRSVHKDRDAARFEFADDGCDGQHECRGAGDVIHEHEPRARRDCGDDRGDRLLWPSDGEWDARGDHLCTAALRAFGGHVVARIVAVVGHEDFVAGLENERTQH